MASKPCFLETLCDNKEIIEANIRSVKISSPDVCTDAPHSRDTLRNPDLGQYRGWDPDKAVQDYYLRIRDHEKYYETVEETTWPFIRIINVSPRMFHSLLIAYTYVGWGEDYGQREWKCEATVGCLPYAIDVQNIQGYLQVRFLDSAMMVADSP